MPPSALSAASPRSLTFVRRPSHSGTPLFAVGLHSNGVIEATFEGTRHAVVAWSCRYAPSLEPSVARCLDLLSILPSDTVQRMSVAVPAHRSAA